MDFPSPYTASHSRQFNPQPSNPSNSSGLDDLAECCICMEAYTKDARAPVSIPCGHTFCKTCVSKFIKAKIVQCCVCNVVSIIGFGNVSKNYAMLQMLEKLNLLAEDTYIESNPPVESYNASDVPEKIYDNIDNNMFNQYCQFYLGFMRNYLNYNLGKSGNSSKRSDFNNAVYKTEQALSAVKKCFEVPKSRYLNPPDPFFHLARTRDMLPPDLSNINDLLGTLNNFYDDDDDVIILDPPTGVQPRRKRPRISSRRPNHSTPTQSILSNLIGASPPPPPAPQQPSGSLQNDLTADLALFDRIVEGISPGYPSLREPSQVLGDRNRQFETPPQYLFTPPPGYPQPSFPPPPYFPGVSNASSSSISSQQPPLTNRFMQLYPPPPPRTQFDQLNQNAFTFGTGPTYGSDIPGTSASFDFSLPSTSRPFNPPQNDEVPTSLGASLDLGPLSNDQYAGNMNSLSLMRQQLARHQQQRMSSYNPYNRAH